MALFYVYLFNQLLQEQKKRGKKMEKKNIVVRKKSLGLYRL